MNNKKIKREFQANKGERKSLPDGRDHHVQDCKERADWLSTSVLLSSALGVLETLTTVMERKTSTILRSSSTQTPWRMDCAAWLQLHPLSPWLHLLLSPSQTPAGQKLLVPKLTLN
jgi:hypothetical protein